MPEIHYSERYDTQASITRPWQAPGGKGFLLRILLWGAALYLLVFFFFGRGMLEAYMDMIRGIAALEGANPSDVEAESLAMLSGLGKLYGSIFFVSLFGWFVAVSVETALHKNIFHGTDHGIFPLRLGRDEGRVMLTQLAIFACMMAIYFGVFIGGILIVAIGAALSGGLAVLLGIIMFFAIIAAFVFIIMLMIRLAPAAAYGVKHGRLVIFEMWKKTKGYGWNIFGSYLIVFFCGYLIISALMYLGLFIVFGDIAAAGLLGGDIPEDPDALFNSLAKTFNKTSVKLSLGLFMIIYMAANIFWYLHMWGIGNYAAEYINERELR